MAASIGHVQCKSALSPSRLPGLDWALNPYKGCAHGCLYCYVQDVTRFALDRPWGSCVEAKVNIASRLKRDLKRGVEGVVGVGTVTDPYQPAESELGLTRSCLAVLRRSGARISVLTKSDLVLRDLDLLRVWDGAEVGLSVGCVDVTVSAWLEPWAPAPARRIQALRELSEAGVDTYLMAAPIVPTVSDSREHVRSLVREALEAKVSRIILDGLNPKPLASGRMAAARPSLGPALARSRLDDWISWVRAAFEEECRPAGITLSDAF